ncbi:unnamed protein product, partial [Onchocerca ochengi]|uniref:Piwi domain-containing protein n=1 Tax=Onchocerca ochengi TaxID=42157 RepID=A0A182F0F6_ONCOC
LYLHCYRQLSDNLDKVQKPTNITIYSFLII